MAVYTTVSKQQAQALFDGLGLGTVQAMQGIASGIENTNYFVQSSGTRLAAPEEHWVLTVFERMDQPLLDYALALMHHLAMRGLPVPSPAVAGDGSLWQRVQGKPAAVVSRLGGISVVQPKAAHGQALGQALAKLHLAGQDFSQRRAHPRGLAWWQAAASEIKGHLPAHKQSLLVDELALQVQQADTLQALPSGPIHADLFRDNVLFEGHADEGNLRLSGLFDFYFAGQGPFIFDLAVCLNDWCLHPQNQLPDVPAMLGLIQAYAQFRPLCEEEKAALPLALRAAALRFWLSRLLDAHQPRPAALLQPKDPSHFERLLRFWGEPLAPALMQGL